MFSVKGCADKKLDMAEAPKEDVDRLFTYEKKFHALQLFEQTVLVKLFETFC